MQYPEFITWRTHIEEQAVLPEGFSTSVTTLDFTPTEKPDAGKLKMNLSALRLDNPTDSFAAVFTKNAFPGWPVVAGRQILKAPRIQGVLVNNKVANVGGKDGLKDSLYLAEKIAEQFGDNDAWIPSSTGVIGWKLPVRDMEAAMPGLRGNIETKSLLPFAEAIMTTDAWPKVRGASCGDGRIVGTAKGAGMVEPNMATMLAFFVTDVDVSRESARKILADVVNRTFNRISVDGETSTSDTVLLLSSRRRPYPGDAAFTESLESCAAALAEDVVRNGEGCGHVFRVTVSGAENESVAVDLARAVANAPLTKTAVRGNDPNIGRILQALGSICGRKGIELNRDVLALDIGGHRVFDGGCFLLDDTTERDLSDYFTECALPLPAPAWPAHEKRVEIGIRIGISGASASIIGSDLS